MDLDFIKCFMTTFWKQIGNQKNDCAVTNIRMDLFLNIKTKPSIYNILEQIPLVPPSAAHPRSPSRPLGRGLRQRFARFSEQAWGQLGPPPPGRVWGATGPTSGEKRGVPRFIEALPNRSALFQPFL